MNDHKLNTVAATKQVSDDKQVLIVRNNGKIKITFLGNSITRHMPKPEIGWVHDWGMAASCLENDYAHIMIKALEEKYTKMINENGKVESVENMGLKTLAYEIKKNKEATYLLFNFEADNKSYVLNLYEKTLE